MRRLLVLTLLCAAVVDAQQLTPTPLKAGTGFQAIGLIQSFKLDGAPPTRDSSATMVLNGLTITLPANIEIVMPGRRMSLWQLFVFNPKNPNNPLNTANPPDPDAALPGANDRPAPNSGLAIEDGPVAAFEASISGNMIQNPSVPGGFLYVAGLVTITQHSLATASGYINAISADGSEFRVGGVTGSSTTGARVRLNDPLGRFGKKQSADVRFSVDDQNPTVHAATGYPMCFPRAVTDAICPATNRPTLAPDPPMDNIHPGTTARILHATCASCDSTQQTPFKVGDYVTYAGIYAQDGGLYVSAYSVEANLAVYTKPGAWPTYLFMEVSLIGTGGSPYPGVDQETGPGKGGAEIPALALRGLPNTRLKVVVFSTDPTRNVRVFAVDRALCGESNWRDTLLNRTRPDGLPGLRFLVNAPRDITPIGRFSGSIDRQNFSPVPYEILAVVDPAGGELHTKVANGLVPGIFNAPVSENLFPENLVIGAPTLPLNLQDFSYLVGSTQVPQLSPWPGHGPWPGNTAVGPMAAPIPKVCMP